jgi:hypothetical protein
MSVTTFYVVLRGCLIVGVVELHLEILAKRNAPLLRLAKVFPGSNARHVHPNCKG